MKTTGRKALRIAAKAWAQPIIRKLAVTGIVAALGLVGLEASNTTVEALASAIVLVVS